MTPTSPPGSPRPARDQADTRSRPRVVERSAGGVVVRSRGPDHDVLLILDPYRKWGLPKGHLEDGESSEAAAVREVAEETGLEELTLGPELGEIDWTFRAHGRIVHKYCRFFLMEAFAGRLQPELSEGITECRWLPVDEAIATVAYENARGILKKAAERLVPAGEGEGGRPWRSEEGGVSEGGG
jgi:8-oxo-dGTP pyrophosphatase MutT (NUDIX family)